MWTVLLPILIVAGIGLIAGGGLAIASVIMEVPSDPKQDAIRECLPGAGCGACGYSGCDGYAAALACGEATDPTLCAPGGEETAAAIGEILGIQAEAGVRKIAVVHCAGNPDTARDKMLYHGTKSCRTAKQLYGGAKACPYGCIGLGDCAKFCPFDAIKMENGLPKVDKAACKACGKCVEVCPKGLFTIEPITAKVQVRCTNKDKGNVAVKVCKASCIGCGLCVKACEQSAIAVKDFLAVIDAEKCTVCGKCKEACRRGAIE